MPVEQWGEAGGQAKRQSPCKGGAIVLQMMSLFAFQGQALHVDFYLVQRCKKCSCSGKIIIEECSAEMGMWVSVLKLQNLNVCQHNAATLELCFLFFFFPQAEYQGYQSLVCPCQEWVKAEASLQEAAL